MSRGKINIFSLQAHKPYDLTFLRLNARYLSTTKERALVPNSHPHLQTANPRPGLAASHPPLRPNSRSKHHLLISDCPGSIVEPMSFSIFLTNALRSMSFAAPHALSNIANGSLLIASATG